MNKRTYIKRCSLLLGTWLFAAISALAAPTVSFDQPRDGDSVSTAFPVNVDAYDTGDRIIERVNLYTKKLLDTEWTPHGRRVVPGAYSWDLTDVPLGTNEVRAIAYNDLGERTFLDIVVTVSNTALLPEISIDSPTNGVAILISDQPFTVYMTADDASGNGLKRVNLFSRLDGSENWVFHGSDTDTNDDQFSIDLSMSLPLGTNTLRAIVTSNDLNEDGTNESKSYDIRVTIKNLTTEPIAPWVSFDSPATNLPVDVSDTVVVNVFANDDNGNGIAKVSLHTKGENDAVWTHYPRIDGLNSSGPYTWTLGSLTEGLNTIRAIATSNDLDAEGNPEQTSEDISINVTSGGGDSITHPNDPQLDFAADEIRDAGLGSLTVNVSIVPDGSDPEAYEINKVGSVVSVTGTDVNGAMYGMLHVADNLKLSLPIVSVDESPFVKKRGIKFNIPLDARSPSYDDGGDSANLNTKNMWDLEGFWKPYIDELARCRFNVLSLWTRHPFPQMVDLSGQYPTINDDEQNKFVYRVKDGLIKYNTKGKTIVDMFMVDDNKWEDGFLDDGTRTGQVDMSLLTRVDGIGIPVFNTIAQKINHWQQVFDYANDRGLEISMIYWNVFTPGAVGHRKHVGGNPVGAQITQEQTNDATIEYVRYAVKQFVLTYPQIKAIGVIAGEHDIEESESWKGDLAGMEEEYNTEHYVYKTYGLGLKEALAEQPGREVKFIWRAHSMEYDYMRDYFMDQYDPDNTGAVQGSIKYCIGRLHSSRTIGEQEWERRAGDFLDDNYYDYKIWLNIRNDDIFMHRWGSPDYVREFIRNMPHEHMAGFYMGSDGFVWARDYFTKTPGMNGQLEINKHWYNFRLWGQLAYNNDIGVDYWIAMLKTHYGLTQANAENLFYAWEEVSEVVPEVVRSHWASSDAGLAIEGAQLGFANSTGFIPFNKFFYNEGTQFSNYKYIPMTLGDSPASIELPSLWVPDWGEAYKNNELSVLNNPDTLTPLEVADRLDGYAEQVDLVIGDLESGNVTPEFQELLWDMQSMAQLGRFYADRTRAAAYYWVARSEDFSGAYATELADAQMYIRDAARHWQDYANILDYHYEPQILARTQVLDWQNTLNHNGDGISGNWGSLPIQTVMDEVRAMLHQFDGRPNLENPEDPYDGTDVEDSNWLKDFPNEAAESQFLSQPYEAN